MRKEHISLSPVYYECLTKLVAQQSLPVGRLKPAVAILALHQGQTYQAVSSTQQVSYYTLRYWVAQFKTDPLAFLSNRSHLALDFISNGTTAAQGKEFP